jgi:hypothetical protein
MISVLLPLLFSGIKYVGPQYREHELKFLNQIHVSKFLISHIFLMLNILRIIFGLP